MTGVAYPAEFMAEIAAKYAVLDDAAAGEFIDGLPERAGEHPAAAVVARQLVGLLEMTTTRAADVADASRRHIELALAYLDWQRCEAALAEASQVPQEDAALGGMPTMLAQVNIFARQTMGEYERADDLTQQLGRDAREQSEPYFAYLDLMVAAFAARRAGHFAQAKSFAEAAGELLPDLSEEVRTDAASGVAIQKAWALIGMHEPLEAEALISRDLAGSADQVEVLLVRIEAMRSQWRLAGASELTERAAQANPLPPLEEWFPTWDQDKISMHYQLAWMHMRAGRYPDAVRVLDEIIGLAPYFTLARALHCHLVALQGCWEQAVSVLKELHEQYPYDQPTLFELAFIQLAWHHYEEADSVAEELSRAYRVNSGAYQLRVAALARSRQLDAAQAVAAEGLERFPSSDGLRVQRGWVRFAQLDFSGAHDDFQSVLDAAPLAPHAKTGIAAVHFQQREYQPALELFREVAAGSTDSGPHANLAWALTAVGEYEEAGRECDLALERGVPSASALTCRSVLAFRDNDLGQALRKAREAVDCDPADLSCQVNLAALLSENGDYEAARRLLEDVLSEDPLLAYAHFELGVLDMKTGSLTSAGRRLRRAIDVDPKLSGWPRK